LDQKESERRDEGRKENCKIGAAEKRSFLSFYLSFYLDLGDFVSAFLEFGLGSTTSNRETIPRKRSKPRFREKGWVSGLTSIF